MLFTSLCRCLIISNIYLYLKEENVQHAKGKVSCKLRANYGRTRANPPPLVLVLNPPPDMLFLVFYIIYALYEKIKSFVTL